MMRNRMLIVDDDKGVLVAMARMARRLGFDVTATHLPLDALALVLAGETYDAMIADIQMAELSGPELASYVDAAGIVLPCVFVSGEAQVEPELPRQTFLEKPFRLEALVAALRSIGVAVPDPAPSND